jgi:hypothetical protein
MLCLWKPIRLNHDARWAHRCQIGGLVGRIYNRRIGDACVFGLLASVGGAGTTGRNQERRNTYR